MHALVVVEHEAFIRVLPSYGLLDGVDQLDLIQQPCRQLAPANLHRVVARPTFAASRQFKFVQNTHVGLLQLMKAPSGQIG